MNETDIINKLTGKGGKLWEKNQYRRIYFNPESWGLETSRYNTGSISNASINGETISNSEARRCQDVKIWFDLTDGKFHTANADRLHGTAKTAIDSFIANALL